MRLISEHGQRHPRANRWQPYAAATLAVGAAAAAGSMAVDPDSAWYRSLNKPGWQPPSWAFGAVWTPLYGSLAFAGGRALDRARGRDRRGVAAGLGVDLALNAGWTWLFFGCRSPRAGAVGTLLLNAANVELIRRVGRADAAAGRALLPYAAWCVFATALNTSIARRNKPKGSRHPAASRRF
ncbi:TspO/MBR family protein [Streptomyces sp. NPDC002057]|uniref:TspO/MBR family protein n=1 Tax=Streptomyces sp. NPDC002057 TaxID=3154664 RepID=UPI00331C5F4C